MAYKLEVLCEQNGEVRAETTHFHNPRQRIVNLEE
jgi:hypothetical protein